MPSQNFAFGKTSLGFNPHSKKTEFSKGKSNFETVLASQNCIFGKVGLCFNPHSKKTEFSKSFQNNQKSNRLKNRNNRLLHVFIA